MVSDISAVLLDAGGVLVGPRGGRWNPRLDFETTLQRSLPAVDLGALPAAVAAGDAFLASTPSTPGRDDYHRVVLAALGVEGPSAGLLAELDAPIDEPVFDVYDDVVDFLTAARGLGLDLAVVTDNWGTSETMSRLLAQVGLDSYFRTIVVSDELGCCKPDPRMFDSAADALGRQRQECLFVDDLPHLVEAAIELGYRGVALTRDGPLSHPPPAVTTLTDLLPLLA